MGYVFGAFAALWVVFMVYAFWLTVLLRRVDDDVRALRQQIGERPEALSESEEATYATPAVGNRT